VRKLTLIASAGGIFPASCFPWKRLRIFIRNNEKVPANFCTYGSREDTSQIFESKILSDIRLPQFAKKHIKSSLVIIKKNFNFQRCCGFGSVSFGKLDPDPHHSEKQDPDLHQSEKVEALEVHFGTLEGPNLKKVSGRIRIRIKLNGRIRIHIRVKGRTRTKIRIKVKSRIRIRVKVTRIRNTDLKL
jgi:hypothetical protein